MSRNDPRKEAKETDQIIIHVDMDAFFAAVEIRDNPTLRGKPLIIGSLPGERGVVATCSYEARKYGVHSAMNIKEAFRLCPTGIYMHPNMEKYKAVSGQLHEIWNSYATALEAIAYDEAYLDVTECAENFDSARQIGHEIKRRVRKELGLSCSVGVAYSKTAAKTASEENHRSHGPLGAHRPQRSASSKGGADQLDTSAPVAYTGPAAPCARNFSPTPPWRYCGRNTIGK